MKMIRGNKKIWVTLASLVAIIIISIVVTVSNVHSKESADENKTSIPKAEVNKDNKKTELKDDKEEQSGSSDVKDTREKTEDASADENKKETTLVNKEKRPLEDTKIEQNEEDTIVEKNTENKATKSKSSTASSPSSKQTTTTQPKEATTTQKTPTNSVPYNGKRIIEEKVTVAFYTKYQNDNTLAQGKTKVAQDGQYGERIDYIEEVYKDGKLVNMYVVDNKWIKRPVDKIIKVGTKVESPSTNYLPAAEAKTILRNAGVFTEYPTVFSINDNFGSIISVEVNNKHVNRITYNGTTYISFGTSYEELLEIFEGDKQQAKKEYEYGLSERKKIEKAVKAAANALYGAGTSQANGLYNQIINSDHFAKDY